MPMPTSTPTPSAASMTPPFTASVGDVLDVTDDSFAAEVLAAPHPVLVDFYTATCAPCRALEPVIHALAAAYRGRARFVRVDLDRAPRVAVRYSVRSVPTMLLFHHGAVVTQLVGFGPSTRPRLEQALDKALTSR